MPTIKRLARGAATAVFYCFMFLMLFAFVAMDIATQREQVEGFEAVLAMIGGLW